MYDLVIIGAGTAGLSAAIYAMRAGLSTLVLEGAMYGGQIIVSLTVENYPGIASVSGAQFAQSLYEQAEALGAQFAFETAISVENHPTHKTVRTDASQYDAKAVILATGAKNRPLGLEGEQRLTGRGISYCATCDGSFFKGKDVAVQGGGNTARDEFRGEQHQVERLRKLPNLQFRLHSTITALQGDNALQAVVIKDLQTGQEEPLAVDGLFVAIGQIPQNEAFRGLVELDERGYVVAGEDCRTSTPGVFAAGDGRTKTVRQLVTAASDGATAALAAAEYIRSV